METIKVNNYVFSNVKQNIMIFDFFVTPNLKNENTFFLILIAGCHLLKWSNNRGTKSERRIFLQPLIILFNYSERYI